MVSGEAKYLPFTLSVRICILAKCFSLGFRLSVEILMKHSDSDSMIQKVLNVVKSDLKKNAQLKKKHD